MVEIAPYLVVGSGCTGATAAQTLIDGGAEVTMVDVGNRSPAYNPAFSGKSFCELRSSESEQYRLFLGEDLECLPRGNVRTGAQLTAPRRHLLHDVARLLPIESSSFEPLESLAYGGLGAGWGLGCNVFSEPELAATGLDCDRMRAAYQLVCRRIGISAARDDATPYTSSFLDSVQPASEPDDNARALLRRYERARRGLNQRGFFLGRPALALLTLDCDGRKATPYDDLDFYSDQQKSAYRPWISVDALRNHARFRYRDGLLALSFRENERDVVVECLDTKNSERTELRCQRLVLACGTLGTARVVLRSVQRDATLPLLCNAYIYVPCLLPAGLGSAFPARRTSLAQLMLFHDPHPGQNFDVAQGSIYSYGSLLLFRLLSQSPLNYKDSIRVMRRLVPALVIVGIHHPKAATSHPALRLIPDATSPTGDRLRIDYHVEQAEQRKNHLREHQFFHALRRLGCHPLKRVDPGHGASIHYAGTLPFDDNERPLRLAHSGRLNGTRRVYVADGSGFGYLPAKGLTLSLMANAHNVARQLLGDA